MLAVLIILLCGVGIYYTRDRWIPFFDGIATRYLPAAENTGELAQGYFPLEISGSDYTVGIMENFFAVLDDTSFSLYSADGKKSIGNQHSCSNPVLYTNNRKALVYDMGGLNFRLESKYKTIYEKKTDQTIILARLSSNDLTAIVTNSDKAICDLSVYDGNGNKIYGINFSERILDVTFTAGNDGCIVTTVDASKGQLVSKLYRYNFDKNEPAWKSQNLDTLVLSTQLRENGAIVAFGDTKSIFCDTRGEVLGSYTYKTQLIDYDDSGTLTALLFKNEGRRKSSLLLIDKITSDIHEINIEDNAKHLEADGQNVLVLTDSAIYGYTPSGTALSAVEVDDSYSDFKRLNQYIYLLRNSEIDRIDYIN